MVRLLPAVLGAVVLAGPDARACAGDVSDIRLELLADGISSPTSIANAGDGRLFVTEKDGVIVIFENGQLRPEPFLDISDRVLSGGERGLLSVAFHPAYAVNGTFFVYYTSSDGDVVIARFVVTDDPDVAEPSSEAVLLEIPQPAANHNGGQLQFGPDGYLYAGPGDGGFGFDPLCRSQDTTSLLGKLLRLDVDTGAGSAPFHAVPPANPFVGDAGVREEIWALGLRNPWRFSFDRATGDLYIADVGQSQREEVNFQPAASAGGENYGWKRMEGDRCTGRSDGCDFAIPGCGAAAYTPPVLVYDHSEGCSVIGGYVYRGNALPALEGAYLYGDLCSGTVWAAERTDGGWEARTLPISAPRLTSFGEDAGGEIYLVAGSGLYRLAGAPEPPACHAGATTLCLNGQRFEVTARWRTADGQSGPGRVVELGADAGYFWFFSDNNPELFVKVLDACFDPFDHFWVFAAGLTDVGVTLTVRDTETGQVRLYESALGEGFEAVRDTQAFATCP